MDYRFAIRCWQDQAGDENAKANVFVDGVQVATEVEITATSYETPSIISWESTGLTAPAADTSFAIKVVLANEYYVDADTDRNININTIGYLTKADDGNYKLRNKETSDSPIVVTTITDFTDITNFSGVATTPTSVTGSGINADWNDSSNSFYTIIVDGDAAGVTITYPVTEESA